jgi:hypothetical protein
VVLDTDASPFGAAHQDWREAIHELAAIDRPSASEGERRAAQRIAELLEALGCRVAIEEEQAHGGYWWPIALANLLATGTGLLALRRGGGVQRMLAAGVSAACAAALWDDLGHGRRWFRRSLMRHRSTWNVAAETGDPQAAHTVALVAHHDAAHSGLVFHPALAQIGPKLFPRAHAKANQHVPILYGVWLGPVMTAAGALLGRRRLLKAGVALSVGATAAMLDIARSPVVPGANDNLSSVGVLIEVARKLQETPLTGVRVLLISTGSEESMSEGMQGFGRRHFSELDPRHTEFLCLECLGGPLLYVLEGEGMLRMRHYPPDMRDSLATAAAQAGIEIRRGLRTVAATDGIIPLRAGYPTVTLASVAETKLPLNYHWPSDAPDALHWETIKQAIAVCQSFLRSRAERGTLARSEEE